MKPDLPSRRARPLRQAQDRLCSFRLCSYWNTIHSACKNAYLRRVTGECVTITHPGHPFSGHRVDVLHFRPRTTPPTILVELPNGDAQSVPVAWTDRAPPTVHRMIGSEGACLSVVILIEIVEWLGGCLRNRNGEGMHEGSDSAG